MSNNLSKRINYLIYYESIYQCAPWINSISIFLEKGFKVNVFQQDKRYIKYNKFSPKDNLSIYDTNINIVLNYLLQGMNKSASLLSKAGFFYVKTVTNKINDFIRSKHFIRSVWKNKSYFNEGDIIIAGDPVSIYIANNISTHINVKLVFWNLELYIESELSDSQKLKWKRIEKECSKRAQIVLEFGNIRRNILIEENKLNPQKVLVIPNSPIGEGKILRNTYFNEKFNIPLNKKIILSAGGISEVNGLSELIYTAQNLSDNYVIILHSKIFTKNKYYNISDKLFFNFDPLPYDKIDLVYSSCDIGIMIMRPNDKASFTNHTYVDWSSGKLFNYAKFGKPLLTNNVPGFDELIINRGAGICFSSRDEIPLGIDKIISNYKVFSMASLSLFNELKFEKYHEMFYHRIFENQIG